MQLTASQTIIKFTHVYKTLSFDLTLYGVTPYYTLCKSGLVQQMQTLSELIVVQLSEWVCTFGNSTVAYCTHPDHRIDLPMVRKLVQLY